MKLVTSLAIVAFVSLSSCSPKVSVNVTKAYPSSHPEFVTVYDLVDTVPQTAERIGSVKVSDTGFTTKCNFDEVLQIAKRETALAGGNGLMLTAHKGPSWASSCHQIEGQMLLVSGVKADSSLIEAEAIRQAEMIKIRRKSLVPANTFFFQAGYGWVTSDLRLSDGTKVNPLGGSEWKVGYNHTFKNGLGVGFVSSGYYREIYNARLKLLYFAPEFTYAFRINKFITRFELGMGVGVYNDVQSEITCFATNLDVRVEYMLTSYLGMNLGIGSWLCVFPDQNQDNYYNNQNKINGIERFILTGGFQFYF